MDSRNISHRTTFPLPGIAPPPALLGEDWIFKAQIKTGRGGECADIAFGSEALRPGHRTRESDHAFPTRRVQSESIQAASCNLGRRKRIDPQLGIPSHLVHPVRVHGGDPRFSLRILADFASCSLSYLLPDPPGPAAEQQALCRLHLHGSSRRREVGAQHHRRALGDEQSGGESASPSRTRPG